MSASEILQLQRQLERLGAGVEIPPINYGSANPSINVTGRPFFRTDLGLWIYYDGTQYLTAESFKSEEWYSKPGAVSASTTDFIGEIRWDHQAYVTRVTMHYFLTGTQDASNYWSITPRMYNSPETTSTDLATVKSTALTVGTGSSYSFTVTTHTDASNRYLFAMSYIKTGAPGAISQLGATLFYRLIIT